MTHQPVLIPTPQRIRHDAGYYTFPSRVTLGISDARLYPLAVLLARSGLHGGVHIVNARIGDAIVVRLLESLKPDAYRLRIHAKGIELQAGSVSAAFHGWQTLRQLMDQAADGRMPCMTIDDWPAIPVRGVYLDIARGRVPTLSGVKRMVDILARYKINQFSLYMQHTFLFRSHPDIGRGASPMTAEDILVLDAYCRERYIELVPSLASFGHMETVLRLPAYHHLAEDYGKGLAGYVTPDPKAREFLTQWCRQQQYIGFSLSPANPGTYRFLDSLYAEFLPLFSSCHFNVCCDETVDLGYGQSYALCQKNGKSRVYLDHLLKLRELCGKYGKQMMCWGDILGHYPELLPKLPKDVIPLVWGYNRDFPADGLRACTQQGREAYACPSTSSFGSLFPRLPIAMANIASAARAAAENGAAGLLNTVWGDGGHFHQPDCEWHGLLFGAEQGWNPKANTADYHERFGRVFFKTRDKDLARAVEALGEITLCYGQIFGWHLFFARPDCRAPAYPHMERVFKGGQWTNRLIRINARCGKETLVRLDRIRDELARHAACPNEDPQRVLPAWLFAVDTLRHAARKIAVLAPGGANTAKARRHLAGELSELMGRHRALWLAQSRPSERRIVWGLYRRALRTIQKNRSVLDIGGIPRGYVSRYLVSRPQSYRGPIRALECPRDPTPAGFTRRDFPMTLSVVPELAARFKGKPLLMYYYVRMICRQAMRVSLGLGYDGPVKAWVDRKPVWCDPRGTNPAGTDKAVVALDLTPGTHDLWIALDANKGLATGVRVRLWRQAESAPGVPDKRRNLPRMDVAWPRTAGKKPL